MDRRQRDILQAIVETFVRTASPIGSKYIYEEYSFDVSPATIRNEMAALESEGLITQPHTSAGRVPTSRAYRMLVDQLSFDKNLMMRAKRDLLAAREQYLLKRTKEKLYDTVSVLAHVTDNVSFVTLPNQKRVFYIGLSHILKKPEFAADPEKTTQVLEVVENNLYEVLAELDILENGNLYIGEENILPEFSSCSLLAYPYHYNGFNGVMGIIGSTRMDYAYNMAALRTAIQLLND